MRLRAAVDEVRTARLRLRHHRHPGRGRPVRPRDLQPGFYRHTRFALQRLFAQAGFATVGITWLEGYHGTMSYQFSMMHKALPSGFAEIRKTVPGRRGLYLTPMIRSAQRLAGRLSREFALADTRAKFAPKKGMPKIYDVVARHQG